MALRIRFVSYLLSLLLFLVVIWGIGNHQTAFAQLPAQSPAEQVVGCDNPANPIAAENCLQGTEDWQNIDYSPEVEIYVSDDSVNVGDRLDFYVFSNSATFDLTIYRIGYYGGMGGRFVETIADIPGGKQPECVHVEDVGLRTCGNWRVSYSMTIPAEWTSGVYAVYATLPGTNAGNETVFVVRDDERKSEILYQMSTTTFQAYNNYEGKSVYSVNSGTCDTVASAPRAVKVSLNRPYNATVFDPNYFYRAEYPMVRWLEQQGYDVAYSTNMDTHRSGKPGAHNALLDHKVFLSVGHDEYWSQPMRDAITAARDAGVHIGFFTANTAYWRIRFEPDPITNEPDSVMVTYKSTESGSPDPSGDPTGTWRDPQGINDPENSITGIMYIGDNDKMYFPLRLSSAYTADRLFRHTGLQNMPPNSYLDVGDQIIGWEWDAPADNGVSPDTLTILAKTPLYGFLLQDAGRSANGNLGTAAAVTTYYKAPSGALVFASGTIQWSWGLGAHGLEIQPADPYIAQITYNVLSDMGVQPATPNDDLILDGSDTPDRELPLDRIKTEGSVPPPVLSDIQVLADQSSFTVTWKTDTEAFGQLWYGTSPDHIINPVLLDRTLNTDHSYTASNLLMGTTYYFKVASTNADSAFVLSDGLSVTTTTGSIPQRFRAMVDPVVRQSLCWVRANRTGAVVIGVLGIMVVGLFLLPTIIIRQRRKKRITLRA